MMKSRTGFRNFQLETEEDRRTIIETQGEPNRTNTLDHGLGQMIIDMSNIIYMSRLKTINTKSSSLLGRLRKLLAFNSDLFSLMEKAKIKELSIADLEVLDARLDASTILATRRSKYKKHNSTGAASAEHEDKRSDRSTTVERLVKGHVHQYIACSSLNALLTSVGLVLLVELSKRRLSYWTTFGYIACFIVPIFVIQQILNIWKAENMKMATMISENRCRSILLDKIKIINSSFYGSSSFKRIISHVFFVSVKEYCRGLSKNIGIIMPPVEILFYSLGMLYCFHYLFTILVVVACTIKGLMKLFVSKRNASSREIAQKFRFTRKYTFEDLFFYFKEVTYSSMSDYFVKRIIEHKILEDQHTELGNTFVLISNMIFFEAFQVLLSLALLFITMAVRNVQDKQDSLFLSVPETIVLMMYVVCFTEAIPVTLSVVQSKQSAKVALELMNIVMNLTSVDRRLNRISCPYFDKLHTGEAVIEHSEIQECTRRYFDSGEFSRLYSYFGLSLNEFLNYLETSANYSFDLSEQKEHLKMALGNDNHLSNSLDLELNRHKEKSQSESMSKDVDSNSEDLSEGAEGYHKEMVSDGLDGGEGTFSSLSMSGLNAKLKIRVGERVAFYVRHSEARFLKVVVEALLGECRHKRNPMSLKGSTCYTNFNDPFFLVGRTIRDNILFGDPYQPLRYTEVHRMLKLGFERFVGEDMMLVSDRGCNLSTIDKTLILLARLLYKDRDIYIVENYLTFRNTFQLRKFHRIFETHLFGKTVIFITNDSQTEIMVTRIFRYEGGKLYPAKLNSQYNTSMMPTKQDNTDIYGKSARDIGGRIGGKEGAVFFDNAREALFITNNDFGLELKLRREYERKRKIIHDAFKGKPASDQLLFGIYMVGQKVSEGEVLFNPTSKPFVEMVDIFGSTFNTRFSKTLIYLLWILEYATKYFICLMLITFISKPDSDGHVVDFNFYDKFFLMLHKLMKKSEQHLGQKENQTDQKQNPEVAVLSIQTIILAVTILVYVVSLCSQAVYFRLKAQAFTNNLHDQLISLIVNLQPRQRDRIKTETLLTLSIDGLHEIEDKLIYRLQSLKQKQKVELILLFIMSSLIAPVLGLVLGLLCFGVVTYVGKTTRKMLNDLLRMYHTRLLKLKDTVVYNLKTTLLYRQQDCPTDIQKQTKTMINNVNRIKMYLDFDIPSIINAHVSWVFLFFKGIMLTVICLCSEQVSRDTSSMILVTISCMMNLFRRYANTQLKETIHIPYIIMLERFKKMAESSGGSGRRNTERRELYGSVQVAFKKVHLYAYQRPILKNISFSLSYNFTYGLIGLDHLAKQSIFDLLMGYHQDDVSTVFSGEVVVKSMEFGHRYKPIIEYKSYYFYLMQEPVFFTGMVRDNLYLNLNDNENDFSEEYVILLLKLFGALKHVQYNSRQKNSFLELPAETGEGVIQTSTFNKLRIDVPTITKSDQKQKTNILKAPIKAKTSIVIHESPELLDLWRLNYQRNGALFKRVSMICSKEKLLREKYLKMRETRLQDHKSKRYLNPPLSNIQLQGLDIPDAVQSPRNSDSNQPQKVPGKISAESNEVNSIKISPRLTPPGSNIYKMRGPPSQENLPRSSDALGGSERTRTNKKPELVSRRRLMSQEDLLKVVSEKDIIKLRGLLNCNIDHVGHNIPPVLKKILSCVKAVLKYPSILMIDQAAINFGLSMANNLEQLKKELPDSILICSVEELSVCDCLDNIMLIDGGMLIEQGNAKHLFDNEDSYFYSYVKTTNKSLYQQWRKIGTQVQSQEAESQSQISLQDIDEYPKPIQSKWRKLSGKIAAEELGSSPNQAYYELPRVVGLPPPPSAEARLKFDAVSQIKRPGKTENKQEEEESSNIFDGLAFF